MSSQSIWWEKTVEYKFILEADRQLGLQFAAPLSGIQERAGDSVFSTDSKIVLVEFKRSEHELDTEHDKFTDYQVAVNELTGKDNHHFLVYGSIDKIEQQDEFCLHACNYFSRNDADDAFSILHRGVEPQEFNEYLTRLVNLKKVDGRSSGTVAPESVASAIGVSSGRASAISLSEYYRIVLPKLYRALTPTYRPSALDFN